MKPLTSKQAMTAEPLDQTFRGDTARCDCGGTLDFSTDLNGYVYERCDRCRSRRPLQRVTRRAESEVLPPALSRVIPVGICSTPGCDKQPIWRGSGAKPDHCPDCQKLRQRTYSRDWQRRQRKAKTKRAA